MELSDLVGTHMLSGVEIGYMTVTNEYWCETQNCQYVKFTLDGIHYSAVEDPNDGYRSWCRELVISEEPPRYSFQPQLMRCYMKEDDDDGFGYGNDILVMEDARTGEVILEVGTADYNAYYPCCHFEYYPEGMACNNPDISEETFNRIIGTR